MRHRVLFTFSGIALCAAAVQPAAAVTLPWLPRELRDPIGTEEKVRGMVPQGLRPAACPTGDLPARLDFREVVTRVLCHNPDTRGAYYGLLAQAANYGRGYSAYMPNVSTSGSFGRSTSFGPGGSTTISRSFGLSGGMTLFDFGQREANIDAAERSLAATGNSFDSTLQGAIGQAMAAYYQLLTSQNAVQATRESLRFAQQGYEAASLRHRIGQVPLADELQAQGAYSQAVLAMQTAVNQFFRDQSALAVLMGLPPGTAPEVAEIDDSTLTRDPFDGQVAELMEKAKSSRYDLAAGRAQVQSSEASLRAVERANLPSISASVSSSSTRLNFFQNGNPRGQSLGLNVSIPIFTGFAQTYNERAAKNQLSQQREQLRKTELTVQQDVWNAWYNYRTALQSWETSWDLLSSATQLKDVALGRYREGLGTILDVLNAQSQYSSALQTQLQSRYNLLTTRVDLVRAVGVLDLETMRPENSQRSSAPLPDASGTNETPAIEKNQ